MTTGDLGFETSMTFIELLLKFVTYAYLPATKTDCGLDPTVVVDMTTGDEALETSTTFSELLELFVTYAYLPETATELGPRPTVVVATTVGWLFSSMRFWMLPETLNLLVLFAMVTFRSPSVFVMNPSPKRVEPEPATNAPLV